MLCRLVSTSSTCLYRGTFSVLYSFQAFGSLQKKIQKSAHNCDATRLRVTHWAQVIFAPKQWAGLKGASLLSLQWPRGHEPMEAGIASKNFLALHRRRRVCRAQVPNSWVGPRSGPHACCRATVYSISRPCASLLWLVVWPKARCSFSRPRQMASYP